MSAMPRVDSVLCTIDFSCSNFMERFRFWQVEVHLNAAAALLERCLEDKDELTDLARAKLNFDVEMEQEEYGIQREQKRIADKYYDASIDIANLQVGQLDGLSELFNEATTNYEAQYVKNRDIAPAVSLHSIARQRWNDEKQMAGLIAKQESNPSVKRLTAPTDVAHATKINKMKLEKSTQGGPFDYTAQMKVIEERLVRDYTEAVERIAAASHGLKLIFAYEVPFERTFVDVENGSIGGTDNAVNWVRDAIRWISSFSALDQTFTVVIPLKRVLQASWDEFLAGKDCEFVISPDIFSEHTYVRMRGLSAALVLSKGSAVASLSVSLPQEAIFFQYNRASGNIVASEPVSQSTVPTCSLGRILNVDSAQPVEVAGAMSLLNASPINHPGGASAWRVRLDVKSIRPGVEINDVLLDLRLTGRAIKKLAVS